MNIIHMVDSEGMFGAEYVIYYLLPNLRRMGMKISFVSLSPTNSPGASLGKLLEKKGIDVFYLNEKKKISLNGLISINRALKISEANILHVHGYKATILGGLIAKWRRMPLFSTYHCESAKHPQLSKYFEIENYFLKYASFLIAVSEDIKKDLVRRGIPEKRISVVYNGIEDMARDNAFPKKNGSCHIICIGRLIPLKRFDLVINAVSTLRKDFPKIHLTIAGSGPLEAELKLMAKRLDLGNCINFAGFTSDTGQLYSKADIFVLPSDTEGAPISVIEAMSFSLPIVATSVGAIPEMLQDLKGTLLIPPGHLDRLVNAIRSLLSRAHYDRKLGSDARARFEECFTAEVMARKYFQLYQMCADHIKTH